MSERCLETYTTAFDRREPFQMEYRLRRHDGEYRWIFDQGVPRFNEDASFVGYIGSCVDVTEHKLAAEALTTVSQKLIQAHEEERTRLARELHDDIIQRLAMLSLHLQRVKLSPPASAAELDQRIGAAIQKIADLATDIQALSHRLHSSKLEFLGLAGAAGGVLRRAVRATGGENRLSHGEHPENAATGDLPVSLPCVARSPAECAQA